MNISPPLKIMLRLIATMRGDQDSYLRGGGKYFMRDSAMVLGLPGAAQLWKVQKYVKIVHDNLDNKTGKWNIYDPRTGSLNYRASPASVLSVLFLHSLDEQEFFDKIKEDALDREKKRAANTFLTKELLEGRDISKEAMEHGLRPRLSRSARQRRKYTAEERRAMRRGNRRSK